MRPDRTAVPANPSIRWEELVRIKAAVDAIRGPCAVAGMTLAALRGWRGCGLPLAPQLVIPATRQGFDRRVVRVRRVQRWSELTVQDGPNGLPVLGVVDGVITLAPDVDDGHLHMIVQKLAYDGLLDVPELMGRRRTGLPGSARITRVGELYLFGFDSPREVEVYRQFWRCGRAPEHINASVRTPDGRKVGPFDGLDGSGAAYEVDGGEFHSSADSDRRDVAKNARAEEVLLEVVRFVAQAEDTRDARLALWTDARARAESKALRGVIEVLHLPAEAAPAGIVRTAARRSPVDSMQDHEEWDRWRLWIRCKITTGGTGTGTGTGAGRGGAG